MDTTTPVRPNFNATTQELALDLDHRQKIKKKMNKKVKWEGNYVWTSVDVIETFFFPTALVETFSSSMKRERQIAFSNKSQAKSGMMMSRWLDRMIPVGRARTLPCRVLAKHGREKKKRKKKWKKKKRNTFRTFKSGEL